MWNLATEPLWSDSTHVILWRNDGYLHSFCNFSRSNAFSENFIRMKFILHKIFFQMSILSSRATSQMSFSLWWKSAENHLWEEMIILRGRGCLVVKINTNFFVRNEVLNIFHITIFSKITAKNNFGGKTIFQRMGCRTTKMNTTFSVGNGLLNTSLKFFL